MATTPQKIYFEIVTPEERLHQDEADQVLLPADEGRIGILPNHAPMVLILKSGIVDVYHADTISERIFIGGGFAHVSEKQCTVMAGEGIRVSDIREADVQQYIADVRAQMQAVREESEREMLQKTLTIARAKLDLIEMLHKGGGRRL